MRWRFDQSALLPADIMSSRTDHLYGKLIRAVLGSYTNHNGMFIPADFDMEDAEYHDYHILEAIHPRSVLTPIQIYEDMIEAGDAVVRVWRVEDVNETERLDACKFAVDTMIGTKYPLSVLRLWVFRIVNKLPWKIHGQWCTRIPWDAFSHIDPNIFNRPDGKRKKNPTPRTFENRLVAGVIRDVTDQVLVPVDVV